MRLATTQTNLATTLTDCNRILSLFVPYGAFLTMLLETHYPALVLLVIKKIWFDMFLSTMSTWLMWLSSMDHSGHVKRWTCQAHLTVQRTREWLSKLLWIKH